MTPNTNVETIKNEVLTEEIAGLCDVYKQTHTHTQSIMVARQWASSRRHGHTHTHTLVRVSGSMCSESELCVLLLYPV